MITLFNRAPMLSVYLFGKFYLILPSASITIQVKIYVFCIPPPKHVRTSLQEVQAINRLPLSSSQIVPFMASNGWSISSFPNRVAHPLIEKRTESQEVPRTSTGGFNPTADVLFIKHIISWERLSHPRPGSSLWIQRNPSNISLLLIVTILLPGASPFFASLSVEMAEPFFILAINAGGPMKNIQKASILEQLI